MAVHDLTIPNIKYLLTLFITTREEPQLDELITFLDDRFLQASRFNKLHEDYDRQLLTIFWQILESLFQLFRQRAVKALETFCNSSTIWL